MFKKILVANRGEIAVRIIRACKELNIPTVAIHSDVDSESMHVRLADESICIGSHKPQNSYLNIGAIMSAAEITGADAIHPGYGFLSENYHFAEIVTKHKIKFIGPSAEIMKKMGDKIEAKRTAKKFGLPIIEGSEGDIKSVDEAKKISSNIGYPVLIKASAGGGGKGMKLVNNEKELPDALAIAKQEAKKYFSNDSVYIEKYFQSPRHIEVQILSDKKTTIHMGERDCSVQRKHQKLIEESPSPVLEEKVRQDLLNKTVNMVSKLNYEGAGTVEFIYDKGKFFFLEMNTRIQVEHPVSEIRGGIDIVKEQIKIASKGKTSLKHIDFSYPYDKRIREKIISAATAKSIILIESGTYGATQGPRLETAAEIQKLRKDGCHIVGMTGMPEACLAKEMEIPYATIAIVVNPAAGLCEGEILLSDMEKILSQGYEICMDILKTVEL